MPRLAALHAGEASRKIVHFAMIAETLNSPAPVTLHAPRRRSGPPAPTISCAPRSRRCVLDPDSTAGRRRLSGRGLRRPTAAPMPPTTSAAPHRRPTDARRQSGGRARPRLSAMFTFAGDKTTARARRASSTRNAINVMRGAGAIGDYLGLPNRRPSTSSTGRWRRPSCGACRQPQPAGRPDRAGHRRRAAASARATAERLLARRRLRRAGRQRRRPRSRAREARARRSLRRRPRARIAHGRHAMRAAVTAAFAVRRARVRRTRHPGRQRRHRLVRADRGDHAGALAQAITTCWPRAIS